MKGHFFFDGGKGGAGFKGFNPWAMKGGFASMFGFAGKGGFKGGKFGGKAFTPELREDESERPEPPANDNLYVKQLPLGATEDMLRDTFGKVGDIAEIRILRPGDFALEGAALIRYASEEQAASARTSLDGAAVHGSTPPLFAKCQTTRQSVSDGDHVYLKNVPTNTTDDKLRDLLSKHGEVKWTKVMRTTNGPGRIGATCGALIEMGSSEQASAAVAALTDQSITFGELVRPMKVRYAANKAAAKAATQQQAAPEEAPQIPGTRLAEGFSPP
jgi:RNA recognition motif-containing protein